jgi:membrane-bound serine protease (ClpP class)
VGCSSGWLRKAVSGTGKVAAATGVMAVLLFVPAFAFSGTIFWAYLKDIPGIGAVEWGMASFVQRVLKEAEEERAEAVVFEIDTLGGRVDAMLFAKDAIFRSPVKTIAFVNSKAWSAGVFLALACERIFIVPDGSIGASEPRSGGEDAEKPDPKAVSAIRAHIEALAEARGRDPRIFAGMVDREVEIPGVKEKGTLLTLSARRALELTVVDGIARGQEEVLEKAELRGEVVTVDPSWSETLARVVTYPAVVSVLLFLAFLGIFLEIMTPGFGVPGIVGIASLLFVFGGRYLAGLSGWEPLLLFLAGMLLLILEIFVIPGFGVTGVLGIAAMGGSLYLLLRTTEQLFSLNALFGTFWYLALAGGALLLFLLFLPYNPLWRKLSLREQSPKGESAPEASPYTGLLGKEGRAKTVLRPAGMVEIEGKVYDAMSRGEFIAAGEAVVVDEVRGNVLVVRRERRSAS